MIYGVLHIGDATDSGWTSISVTYPTPENRSKKTDSGFSVDAAWQRTGYLFIKGFWGDEGRQTFNPVLDVATVKITRQHFSSNGQ